ncbi:hypothetical protein [Ulvibacter antarcticus]|nr:hypothetical protein [Ulvibacter antarcticus]
MKKITILLLSFIVFSCSSEKEQMETVRALAKQDLITFLQLPEGTIFNDKDFAITEVPEIEGIGITYVVKIGISSQDRDGNTNVKTHKLEYAKIGEKGLSPDDYELTSFD